MLSWSAILAVFVSFMVTAVLAWIYLALDKKAKAGTAPAWAPKVAFVPAAIALVIWYAAIGNYRLSLRSRSSSAW